MRLKLDEVYAYNIGQDIKNEPIDKGLSKDVLSLSQAKALILKTKVNRKYIWHYRDYAIIYLMITTAIRSFEVRRAKISDLKYLNSQLVLYIQGKGKYSKESYVKITNFTD